MDHYGLRTKTEAVELARRARTVAAWRILAAPAALLVP
jgi:hypothetical protein